jgi:hypothetical protein
MANGTIAASQLEMLSLSGTGIITITPPATNTNRAITLPDAAGALVVSGTTPSLNGITFPATQVPSADANTLDDYEEGTWTPSLGGTTTYGGQTGSYIKIGRMVTVKATIVVTLIGTGSNNAISGLPFTCNSLYALPVGYFDTINTSVINLSVRTVQSSTTMTMTGVASASTAITDSFNTFKNSTYIEFSGTYFTT